ncbi:MAG: hypothetical protein KIS78_19860 [Labilithrix sp.]|nr:hypothetical protein [Labilithrix sp.]MCW5834669.1 hypothetical protein [Labilithrix sp.]
MGALLVAIVTLSLANACAGGKGAPASGASAPIADDDADAGSDAGQERPFAGSAAEATTLISAAVDKKGSAIGACVRDFRARKNLLRERVTVSFGIDMEGTLLGVTSKGNEDAELKACVQGALKDATFPRSHAGVITVTKTYEEILQ